MKCLALSQPWAELVVSGKKKIEIRGKNTSHRGWFYIYAAAAGTKELWLKHFGFENNLPTGMIVGKAFLADVKLYATDEEFDSDEKLHFAIRPAIKDEGWDHKHKFGYILSEAKRIEPVKWRGMPGFFNVDIKEELL